MFAFYSGLGRAQFAASHEARVAQVARVMAVSRWPWNAKRVEVRDARWVKRFGVSRVVPDPASKIAVNPWIVPVLDEHVRLEKPPLPYWCTAVVFKLVGVSEAAARFVPATLGLVATLLVFSLAKMLYGAEVAWVAALLWPTTYLVSQDYRLAIADPYLAFFSLLAVWAWVRASRSRESRGTLLIFYAAMGLGALAKGPVVLMTALLPIALFHACFRAAFPRGVLWHVCGIILCGAIAVPWPVAIARQLPIAPAVWWGQLLGRGGGESGEDARGVLYYVQSLPFLALPWVPLWLLSLAFPFRRRRGKELFPILWYVLSVVFFTAMSQKKLPYLLPMIPAQTLMLATAAAPFIRLARRGRTPGLIRAAVVLQILVVIGWAFTTLVLVWREWGAQRISLTVCLLAIAIALLPSRATIQRYLVAQAIACAVVIGVFAEVYLWPVNNARSPKALCEELRPLIDGSHRELIVPLLPPEVAFYLPLRLPKGIAPGEYIVVTDDQRGLRTRARSRRAAELPEAEMCEPWVGSAKIVSIRRVPMQSAPGDARYKVYAIAVERRILARS